MRKISIEAARAFKEARTFRKGNMKVMIADGMATLLLHNNVIARKIISNPFFSVTLAGWGTVATRERLNTLIYIMGVPKIRFVQRNGSQYFDSIELETNEEIINISLQTHNYIVV